MVSELSAGSARDDGEEPPIIIIGAGPVGMMAALLLARSGVRSVLFDQREDSTCRESRALAVQRDVLAVFDRVGLAEPIIASGLGWARGRIFLKDALVQERRFAGGEGAVYPLVINLPQYDIERLLYEALAGNELVDVRLNHTLLDLEQDDGCVRLVVKGADGSTEEHRAQFVIGADGIRSSVRKLAQIPFTGAGAQGRILVADFRADLPLEHERTVWFYPDFYPSDFVMKHSFDPTGWRLDWHYSLDAEEIDASPAPVRAMIRKVIGDCEVELLRSNVYTYYQLQAETFRKDRIFLIGDAAHVFAPYGARGMNSGIEDADNLAWKLASVLRGDGGDGLLDSYAEERSAAAEFHADIVSSAVRFMAPKDGQELAARDEVLSRARTDAAWAQRISSGTLYEPYPYSPSRLTAQLSSAGDRLYAGDPNEGVAAGYPMVDAYCDVDGSRQSMRSVLGGRTSVLIVASPAEKAADIARDIVRAVDVPVSVVVEQPYPGLPGSVRQLVDPTGAVSALYGAPEPVMYVIRPDCYVAVHAHLNGSGVAPAALAKLGVDIAAGRGDAEESAGRRSA